MNNKTKSQRRKELIEDLERHDAIDPEKARFVLGSNHRLALKMVNDKQLGKVSYKVSDIWNGGNVGLKDPPYKFYVIKK